MSEKKNNSDAVKKRKTVSRPLAVAGVLTSVFFGAVSIWFMYEFNKIGVLPTNYRGLFGLILFLFFLESIILQYKRRTIPSIIMMGVLSAGLVLGTYYVALSNQALEMITDTSVSVDVLGMYTEKNDQAESLEDIVDDKIGVLKTPGRELTDEAVNAANKEGKCDFHVVEYNGMPQLAHALQKQKIRAILVNSAYLGLLDEIEDLRNFQDKTKMVWSYEIHRDLNIEDSGFEKKAKKMSSRGKKKVSSDGQSLLEKPFVVYVSGNDSEGELISNGRSDVNILAAVDPVKHKVLLVNTPRDYYVKLSDIGEKDKLTHAGIYGVDTSMKTLARLYDIPVPYYIRLNFTGFVDIIDALGGVTVSSDVDFTVGDWHYVVGENELSGIEALAFARERYSFADGDRQRGRNQQAVIKAIIRKACSPEILKSYSKLMEAVSSSVETNIPAQEITGLVQAQIKNNKSWKVQSISVDGTGSNGPCYSAPNYSTYRMIPDKKTVKAAKKRLKKIL